MTIDPDFNIGGTTYPLTADGYNLLREVDKPIAACINFIQTVLSHHLQAKFSEVLSVAGFSIPSNPDGYIVAQAIPYDPASWMEENQFRFPLVAVERVSETYHWHTLQQRTAKAIWRITFVMPAMNASTMKYLQAVPRAVSVVLRRALEDGSDASYVDQDGYTINWGEGCGIDGFSPLKSGFTMWKLKADGSANGTGGPSGLLFPVWEMEAEVSERDMVGPATASNVLTGIDTEIDVNGGWIDDL